MYKFYPCLMLFLWCLLTTPAAAIEVSDLYKELIPVENQSRSERNKAYKAAFKTVLVRISGSTDILQHQQIKRTLRKPAKFVSRYQFIKQKDQQYLEIEFNSQGINHLLRQHQFPIWGSRRPLILAWIVEEQASQRQLIAEDNDLYHKVIKPVADKRGLPIIVPILDFDDLAQIQVSDVWGGFVSPIRAASARYLPERVISVKIFQPQQDEQEQSETGSIYQPLGITPLTRPDSVTNRADLNTEPPSVKNENETNKDWHVQLTMYQEYNDLQLESSAKSKQAAVADVIDQLANKLAGAYAIEAQKMSVGEQELHIHFIDINNIADVIKIEDFLKTLSAVESVRVSQIIGDQVNYQLSLLGEAIDVFTALQLDERVEQIKTLAHYDEAEQLEVNVIHKYKWKGQ